MKNLKYYSHTLLIKAFFLLSIVIAPTTWSQNYYPLEEGNVWYLYRYPYAIIGKETINGVEYYKTSDEKFIRSDKDGNVYVLYENSNEYLWIKLKADLNETWEFQYNTSIGIFRGFGTLASKTDTVHTADTTFINCYRYVYHYANIIDADYEITLAPDVGLVKSRSIDWGLGSSLIKSMVNGKRIPSQIILPQIAITNPEDNQNNIPLDAQISFGITFQIKPEFVNYENIKMFSKKKGELTFHFDQSWGGSTHDIRFTPDVPFVNDDTITVFISKNLEDYMGDNLPDDYAFTFHTESPFINPDIFQKDTVSQISELRWGDFDFGDYDNDGDKDLLLYGIDENVSPSIPKVEIYKNNSGIFEATDYSFVATRPSSIYSNCVKWIDFNNDGLLDLAFSGYDENNNSITKFYENQNSEFILKSDMSLPFGPAHMEWTDYNYDGFIDLAIVGNARPNNKNILIYKNVNGNLELNSLLSLENYWQGEHTWIDLNQDGKQDIIKTGNYLNEIKFFENVNNGFQEIYPEILSNEYTSYNYNIDFSDIDKDGDLDIIVGNKLLKKNNNQYVYEEYDFRDFRNCFVKFFDYTQDGYDDLFLIGDKDDEIGRTRTYINIYQNINGGFSLWKEIRFEKYSYLFSAKWLDLNNDNVVDLAAMTEDGFIIFYNKMDPSEFKGDNPQINFSLSQNFPNPFNGSSIIKYKIPSTSNITITVYDLLGRKITTLVDEVKSAGEHQVEFDASSLSSGVYFYKLQAGDFVQTRKMILLK